MTTAISVRADLRFSVTLPGREPLAGTLVGTGNDLELRLDNAVAFAGRGDAGVVRAVADVLAGYGVKVSVIAEGRPLLELGATRAGWLQRRVTGSRHLRVVSLRGAVTGARGSARGGGGVLPGRELVPPTTLYPLAPTFARQPLAPVSTTHDPRRGGNPRLVLTVGNDRLPDSGQVIFPLGRETTTIGSDDTCDVRLRGLADFQAKIVHDENDELVLVDLSRTGTTRLNGARVERRLLRTGARVELGPWKFAYRRAEYADHGRPFGGRIGGELGHQKPQTGRNNGSDNPQ